MAKTRLIFKTQNPSKIKYIVGVDEVGRGPLAGPVAIGAVLFEVRKFQGDKFFLPKNTQNFLGARDSKQLSPAARETWFEKIRHGRREGVLDFRVAFVGAAKVDTCGLTHSISLAMRRVLDRLSLNPSQTLILLDGGLKAPEHFLFQRTIIGGDRTEPIISLASIAAKVLRDRKMCKLAKIYPEFGFEKHKGYGTSFHIKKIRQNGLCDLHRRSFVKNFTENFA